MYVYKLRMFVLVCMYIFYVAFSILHRGSRGMQSILFYAIALSYVCGYGHVAHDCALDAICETRKIFTASFEPEP